MHLWLTRLLLISTLSLVLPQDPSKPAPNPEPQKTQDSAAPAAPSAPATPQAAAPSSGASPSMATCYLYRPRIYRGSGERIGIFIDGIMAANLVNGRWVALQVPPGHHIIKPKDNQSGAEADFEPGKEYYFKTSWGETGMFHGAHKLLIPVMKEQATYEIKQLKPLDKEDIAWPSDRPAASSKP
jgi:hypothetical protein